MFGLGARAQAGERAMNAPRMCGCGLRGMRSAGRLLPGFRALRQPFSPTLQSAHFSVSSPAANSATAILSADSTSSVHPAASSIAISPGAARQAGRQTVDFTALQACAMEIQRELVPSKLEQLVMADKTSVSLRLRSLRSPGTWITLSWHHQAGRVCLAAAGPLRTGAASEVYSLQEQLSSKLQGLVLLEVSLPQPWERVVQLKFGVRPHEPPSCSLYCEVMARYSNLLLVDPQGIILACAYQVGGAMSSLRLLQTGRPYQLPPLTSGLAPDSVKGLEEWRAVVERAAAIAAEAAADKASRRRPQQSAKSPAPQTTDAASAAPPPATAVPFADPAAPEAEQRLHNSSHTQPWGRPFTASDSASEKQTRSETGFEPGSPDVPSLAASAPLGQRRGPLLVAEGLLRGFHGVSPALAAELLESAGCDPEVVTGSMQPMQWDRLWASWQGWLALVAAGNFMPCSDEELTRYSMLGGLPRPHSSPSALVDAYYSQLQAGEQHTVLHQRCVSAVAAGIKKLNNKIKAFSSQLDSADGADMVQRQADMITANLYRVTPGASHVMCEDWDTGHTVRLELDPLKTPVQAAEALYKRARKLRRSLAAVQPLLTAAQAELEYLQEVEETLRQLEVFRGLDDAKALKEVQDELVAEGVMKPPPDAQLAAKSEARAKRQAAKGAKAAGGGAAAGGAASGLGSGFRVFTSPGGYQVLVGRNNRQNDELSNKVANPDDLWMHLRGRPGSHTVLRVPSGRRAPDLHGDPDTQFAADLAAFFSKGRNETKVDILVAKAGALKKPKGAKPGQILVTKELGNVVARPGNSVAAQSSAAE